MMMICIAPKWNNADKIRITISRIIGSSSIHAKWKIAQKESNYVTFTIAGKLFTTVGNILPSKENFLILLENILPLKENCLLLRENILPSKEKNLYGWQTFYYDGKTF